MLEKYLTVQSYGEAKYEINKSLFIAYVQRTTSEEEAQKFIAKIRKKHYDATHNCSAYVIGANDQIQRSSDDGEPSGTAGRPILEVIKKNHLKDTTIVVTRYFGGIKLGAGGLIRAYGKSASLGIQATGIVKRELHSIISINIDYGFLGTIENQLRTNNYSIDKIEYLDKVTIFVLVPKGTEEKLKQEIINLTSAQAEISITGEKYTETALKSS